MATIAETPDGKLQGTIGVNLDGKPFLEFFGIRYGKPPVGDLRFKPPQPINPWSGVVDATQVGNRSFARDDLTVELGGSEDCLFLNVYCWSLPKANSKLRPVMVYIHGGGFIFGSSRPGIYGPEFLMTNDIVVVTINYRLGILGFLSVDGTEVTGNMGLKDQNLALKWVQRNISAFGGDPNNVTIFGESAGAASVHAHVLSAASKGLFHKAIMQSGCTLCPWFYGAKNNAREIVHKMGLEATSEIEALDILMKADGLDIYKAQEKIPDFSRMTSKRPFCPVIEAPNPTAFLTEHAKDIIKAGNYNKVPMIFSYNDAEGLLQHYLAALQQIENYPLNLEDAIPSDISLGDEERSKTLGILQHLYNDPSVSYNLLSDLWFLTSITEAITGHLKSTQQPIYLLRFSSETGLNYFKNALEKLGRHVPEPGACHADDLGYLWKSEVTPEFLPGSKEDRYLRTFMELWTNFAKFGNPKSATISQVGVNWQSVKNDSQLELLEFGEVFEIKPDIPERKRVDTLLSIYKTWNTKKH